ncbi:hypothetical protein AZF37_02210 [endosymbiont 'TC1' of Trimyema compressum]|uniref:TrkH family potassium uptake protein n=1 Tax=endosymbiont 'TC1' of Trimyema compressum TaxID=243899 RepID=UPI0007F14202|nr:TrkH family potassium uptake protein [endosymbiont 'TC1' of Trimyema compressum]AMP20142.1 hypothetical protein AZF37_02210 [endosymbiont 'TC1' of Trimyema compressum]
MKLEIDKKIVNSYKSVFGFGGTLLIVFGFVLLLPIASCLFYPEEVNQIMYFVVPGLVFIACGFFLRYLFRATREEYLTFRQDTILVLLTWIIAPLSSTIPFMLAKELTFPLAFFEMVSGWTSTGLSVVDVENIPKIFLLHRSITEFFGGIGIVLVVLSVLSTGFGVRLFTSEGHVERVMPNLGKTTRVILAIYSGYAIGGALLYTLAGMPLFDSINHAMAAISTGGFSTQTDGIAYYNNDLIYLISIILMILGSLGFSSHLLLLKGKFKRFTNVSEIRLFILFIAAAIPIVVFFGLSQFYGSLGEAFKASFFDIVSAISTTGFSYSAVWDWPNFPVFVLVLLMLIGGCFGSTSGGIKVFRVLVLLKNLIWNITRNLKPQRLVFENFVMKSDGKQYINHRLVSQAASYIFIFLLTYSIGVSILMTLGYSFRDSFFEFASAVGTVGLTIGVTTPDMPPVALWTEIVGMLMGRLEIYVIFIAVLKVLKDVKNVVSLKK